MKGQAGFQFPVSTSAPYTLSLSHVPSELMFTIYSRDDRSPLPPHQSLNCSHRPKFPRPKDASLLKLADDNLDQSSSSRSKTTLRKQICWLLASVCYFRELASPAHWGLVHLLASWNTAAKQLARVGVTAYFVLACNF